MVLVARREGGGGRNGSRHLPRPLDDGDCSPGAGRRRRGARRSGIHTEERSEEGGSGSERENHDGSRSCRRKPVEEEGGEGRRGDKGPRGREVGNDRAGGCETESALDGKRKGLGACSWAGSALATWTVDDREAENGCRPAGNPPGGFG